VLPTTLLPLPSQDFAEALFDCLTVLAPHNLSRLGNRRVLRSGRLALSTGRPGIYLYTAADPPTEWSRFNIAAAHNKLVVQRNLTFESDVPGGAVNGTTSYTGMAVAQDGTEDAVYVTYDRLGNGWGTVSQGQASAVFAMRLTISA
jgi:hypothetical protein